MRGSERRQPAGVAADQQHVWNQPVAVGQWQAAFGRDGQQIGHMLGGAHATGGAIDDDTDTNFNHLDYPSGLLRGSRMLQIASALATPAAITR